MDQLRTADLTVETGRAHQAAGDPPRVRLLSILWRLVLAVAVLAGAVYFAMQWFAERPQPPQRQARERSFTVEVTPATPATFSPAITSFGEIVAGRNIDLRAQVGGEAVEVSPNLVAGGRVSAGELLVSIDPFDYEGAVRQAEADLADAQLQLTSAQEQLRLNRSNLEAAQTQLDLAQRDFERARTLAETGSLNSQTVDSRELVVSQRRQTVEQQQSAITLQEATIARQETAIARAQWQLDQANRALTNTVIRAPYDGVVTTASVAAGRVVTNNEVVAQIYEADALEVRFTLSDAEYGQLTAVGLDGRPVEVTWNVEPTPIVATGQVERIGAEVDATLGGVSVFAGLDGGQVSALRPGTFVLVAVNGIAYDNALRVPETAIYDNDRIYIINDEARMQSVPVTILTRDGEHVIVRGEVPEGAEIVTTHLAQAGEGVLVQIEGAEPSQSFNRATGGAAPAGELPARPDGERPAGDGTSAGQRSEGTGQAGQRPGGAPGGNAGGNRPGGGEPVSPGDL